MKEWNALVEHLNSNYYKPDTEALAATLSVATAHYFPQDEPVWLMVIGSPGTGKTSVCIHALKALPDVYNVDTLTPNTFLSGFSKGVGQNCSMLNSIGTEEDRSGIFAMAEFSSFLGLREENRREIGSQMRRIYDGYLDRATGVGWLEWHGKVTFIVAATSGAERAWGTMKDLGERFMAVRWPRGDGIEQAKAAQRQIGRKQEIEDATIDLVSKLVGDHFPGTRPIDLSEEVIDYWGIAYLAEIIATTRAKVERDKSWKREIVEESEAEGPTRIMKAMVQTAMGHAALMRRDVCNEADFKIARRLGMDSIPPARLSAIRSLCSFDNGGIGSFATLVRATGMPSATLNWTLEDLVHLGMIEFLSNEIVEKTYRITDHFQALLAGAARIMEL